MPTTTLLSEAQPLAVVRVGRCSPIHPNAKVTKFEVRARKTLITLWSKNVIATRAWVFRGLPNFTQRPFFHDLLL
jgi:hypothetical protein